MSRPPNTVKVSSMIAESELPRHEAERLLVAVTGRPRAWMIGDPEVSERWAAAFFELADRRRRGEPLQYLEGTVQFGPIELLVDPRVLIPRPETEQLFEIAIDLISDVAAPVVVDLCTGSGNVALAIKHARPDSDVYATDVSAEAIEVAEANARRTGLQAVFHIGSTYDPLDPALRGGVDLIAANPPYVAAGEVDTLPVDVRDHEPRAALVAGESGDEVLAEIAAGAADWLAPGGWLICEINEYRAEQALALLASLDTAIRNDLAGRPRFVIGRLIP
ncbi:MAG TPA: peptide chain release factor N(5)-glutamine methyltransferase [Acidimicrobiia bacterium]|jgi:release factor glutamine methyltransferase